MEIIASLTKLLGILNSLSPIAVIGLLGVIIFMLVTGKTSTGRRVLEVKDNHLHELPDMSRDMKAISDTLQRLEVTITKEFSYIRARLNGRKD